MVVQRVAPLLVVLSDVRIRAHWSELARQYKRVVVDTTHGLFTASDAVATSFVFHSPIARKFVVYMIGKILSKLTAATQRFSDQSTSNHASTRRDDISRYISRVFQVKDAQRFCLFIYLFIRGVIV